MDLFDGPSLTHAAKQEVAFIQARLDVRHASPEAYSAMLGLEAAISRFSTLDRGLIELVKIRASQINGCAYCLDMHSKEARTGGETEQRLYALPVWRETPFFTDQERAALAWTDAVTLISEGPVPDAIFDDVTRYFSEKELVDLTLVCVAINGWNRLLVPFRAVPGDSPPAFRPIPKGRS